MLDDSCKLHIVKHAFRINWCSMQHVINFLIWKSVVRKKKFTCLVSKHMLPLGFLDWHHFSVIVMYSLMLQGIRASMVINTKRTKISRLKQRLNCSCHCVSRHHFIFLFTYSLLFKPWDNFWAVNNTDYNVRQWFQSIHWTFAKMMWWKLSLRVPMEVHILKQSTLVSGSTLSVGWSCWWQHVSPLAFICQKVHIIIIVEKTN